MWVFCQVLVMLLLNSSVKTERNNVCKTYLSYFFKDISADCYYSPDLFQSVVEIAMRHTGTVEIYNITTEDGFILTTFRLPPKNKKSKGIILMQHPLLVNANIWLNQDNQSTALLFWDQGYDIWLGNNRGNYYAKHHVNLTTKDEMFWNWSFHEMGLYDHKAVIDFIRNITNYENKIIFLTHSMSGTSSLIYASLRPEEAAENVRVIINMAPIIYMKYVRTPLKFLALLEPILKFFTRLFKSYSIFSYYFIPTLFRYILTESAIVKPILAILLCITNGCTINQYDPIYYNYMVSEFPSEVSWKTIFHYMQFANSGGKYQQYDYGPGNLQKYGNDTPPQYPVDKIKIPSYIVYSKSDSCSTSQDNQLLISKLPEAAIAGTLEIEGINHLEFHYGRDTEKKIYQPVLEFLDKL